MDNNRSELCEVQEPAVFQPDRVEQSNRVTGVQFEGVKVIEHAIGMAGVVVTENQY